MYYIVDFQLNLHLQIYFFNTSNNGQEIILSASWSMKREKLLHPMNNTKTNMFEICSNSCKVFVYRKMIFCQNRCLIPFYSLHIKDIDKHGKIKDLIQQKLGIPQGAQTKGVIRVCRSIEFADIIQFKTEGLSNFHVT